MSPERLKEISASADADVLTMDWALLAEAVIRLRKTTTDEVDLLPMEDEPRNGKPFLIYLRSRFADFQHDPLIAKRRIDLGNDNYPQWNCGNIAYDFSFCELQDEFIGWRPLPKIKGVQG